MDSGSGRQDEGLHLEITAGATQASPAFQAVIEKVRALEAGLASAATASSETSDRMVAGQAAVAESTDQMRARFADNQRLMASIAEETSNKTLALRIAQLNHETELGRQSYEQQAELLEKLLIDTKSSVAQRIAIERQLGAVQREIVRQSIADSRAEVEAGQISADTQKASLRSIAAESTYTRTVREEAAVEIARIEKTESAEAARAFIVAEEAKQAAVKERFAAERVQLAEMARERKAVSKELAGAALNAGYLLPGPAGMAAQTLGYSGGSGLGLGLGVGVLAAAGGAAVIAETIKAASEEESVIRRLKVAVDDAGGSFADSKTKIVAWAELQERTTTFGRDQTLPQLQALIDGGLKVGDSMSVIRIAEDLAAGSGKSLEQVTQALRAAYEGNARGLVTMGLATKDQIKDGMSFEQVLAVVEQRYHGQAEATDTVAGKTAQFQNALKHLESEFGGEFLDSVTKGTESITLFVQSIDGKAIGSGLADFLKSTIGLMRDLGGVIGSVNKGLNDLAEDSNKFGSMSRAALKLGTTGDRGDTGGVDPSGGDGVGPTTSRGAAGNAPGTNQYTALIDRYARANRIDPRLLAAVLSNESSGVNGQTSSTGAQGLGQLMPGTARDMGVTNPFDPEQNIRGSAKYLAEQLQRFGGDVATAIAAYHDGPGNVQSYGGDLRKVSAEGKGEMADVLRRYRQSGGGAGPIDPNPVNTHVSGATQGTGTHLDEFQQKLNDAQRLELAQRLAGVQEYRQAYEATLKDLATQETVLAADRTKTQHQRDTAAKEARQAMQLLVGAQNQDAAEYKRTHKGGSGPVDQLAPDSSAKVDGFVASQGRLEAVIKSAKDELLHYSEAVRLSTTAEGEKQAKMELAVQTHNRAAVAIRELTTQDRAENAERAKLNALLPEEITRRDTLWRSVNAYGASLGEAGAQTQSERQELRRLNKEHEEAVRAFDHTYASVQTLTSYLDRNSHAIQENRAHLQDLNAVLATNARAEETAAAAAAKRQLDATVKDLAAEFGKTGIGGTNANRQKASDDRLALEHATYGVSIEEQRRYFESLYNDEVSANGRYSEEATRLYGELSKIQGETNKKRVDDAKAASDRIIGYESTFLDSFISKHKSMRDSLRDVWSSIVKDFEASLIKMIESKYLNQFVSKITGFLGVGGFAGAGGGAIAGGGAATGTLGGLGGLFGGGASSGGAVFSLSPTSIEKLTGSTQGVSPFSGQAPSGTTNSAGNIVPATSFLGRAAGGAAQGLALSAITSGMFGGNSQGSAFGGALGGIAGIALHANPLMGAGIDVAASLIGSLFGNHDNPAKMPDKYDTQNFGQIVADLQGSNGANGKSFLESGQMLQALGNKTQISFIEEALAKATKGANGAYTLANGAELSALQFQKYLEAFGASATGSGKLNFGKDIGQEFISGAAGATNSFKSYTELGALAQQFISLSGGATSTAPSTTAAAFSLSRAYPDANIASLIANGSYTPTATNGAMPSVTGVGGWRDVFSGGGTAPGNGSGIAPIHIVVNGNIVGTGGMHELAQIVSKATFDNDTGLGRSGYVASGPKRFNGDGS